MTLESRLRDTFDHEAARVQVPLPPVDEILAGGTARVRRRRAGTVATVVAAVLIVVAGSLAVASTMGPEVAPAVPAGAAETAADLPVGDPPALPHCVAGRGTVLDGRTVWRGCGVMVSRGGTTVVLTDRGTELVTEQGLVFLARDNGGWFPAVSRDGDLVAFLVGGVDKRLAVFDVQDPSAVRRLADEPLDLVNAWVPGIDDQHRAYVWSFDEEAAWVYDVGEGRLRQVTGLPEAVKGPGPRYVTADGFAVATSFFTETGNETDVSVEGDVDHSGAFERGLHRPIGWSQWSPDGLRLVQETRDGWWVQPGDASSKVRLQLPIEGRAIALPVWESDHHVLVPFDPQGDASVPAGNDPQNGSLVDTRDQYLLRCAARDGRCEVAMRPDTGPAGVTGPLYR